MASTDTRSSRVTALKAIVVTMGVVVASALFAKWGYDLTGRQGRWGETIWENDNWFGAAFFGFGVTSGIVFLAFFTHRMGLRLCGKKAVATITKVEQRVAVFSSRSELHRELGGPSSALSMQTSKRAIVYAKCFGFTALNGRTYEVRSDVETNRVLQEGQEVTVLYFRWNPDRARLFDHLGFYAPVYLFTITALVFTVVGAIMLELLD